MSEPKPPLVALQKAAKALHREANALVVDSLRSRHIDALHRAAGNLIEIAANLAWLGYPERILDPLERTADVLGKLSLSDVDDDNGSVMTATADALEATGEALYECPADKEKLGKIGFVRGGGIQPARDGIQHSLTKIAKALRTQASADAPKVHIEALENAANEIQTMLAAVAKVRKGASLTDCR